MKPTPEQFMDIADDVEKLHLRTNIQLENGYSWIEANRYLIVYHSRVRRLTKGLKIYLYRSIPTMRDGKQPKPNWSMHQNEHLVVYYRYMGHDQPSTFLHRGPWEAELADVFEQLQTDINAEKRRRLLEDQLVEQEQEQLVESFRQMYDSEG